MAKFARWAALAAFCAAFGFGGSVGGVALMQDNLRGEDGSTGPTGSQGPPGPAGPVGPAANTTGLVFDVGQLQRRLEDLENSGRGCTLVAQLVTDVSTFPTVSGPTLNVSKTPFLVCVNPPGP